MNRITLTLKRPFIWLSRFRHRCGYGVHSPFAFNLITQVIYESTPYYKYKDLADLGIIFFDKTKIKQNYIVNF